MAVAHLKSINRRNVETMRKQPLAEISGSLGDLGTFLPITIALATADQISLSATLVFTGLFNIITGCVFGIPLPVQPMKAVAATALLASLTARETQAAGLFVAACVLILSVTGLLRWFTDAIPIPVVKGIQVGAGLALILSAGTKAMTSLSWTGPSWADNYIWLLSAFILLMLLVNAPRVPFALAIFILGLIFASVRLATSSYPHVPNFSVWFPDFRVPSGSEWKTGILSAGIGQLPLTTLNSIVAVVHLSSDLLPDLSSPSATSIGLSVALMNLSSCWFGSMPVCHGSGGLAAQYRFGARSGASIIFLGAVKLVLGCFFASPLMNLLDRFPIALLTIMVFGAGLELAGVGEGLNTTRSRDLEKEPGQEERKTRWNVMLTTLGFQLAFKNNAVGFVAGMLCHWSYETPEIISRVTSGRWRRFFGDNPLPEEQSLLSHET